MIAVERCLTGIARGCGQNECIALDPGLFERAGEQVRHYLKRHILEGAGRTVKELEHRDLVTERVHRSSAALAGKALCAVCTLRVAEQLLLGIVGKKL